MTRSKLLEQIKVVADGTTAFAKGSAGTAVVVADGAGKLQTCDTSSGTFEDYATLADGVNNVILDGAKEYLKVITSTGAVVVLGDFAVDPAN
jgi:accessory colonization factor AcfC